MKNLLLLILLVLSFAACKEDLTEAEQIARLVEQRWTPTEDCECPTECNAEYLNISSNMICYKVPNIVLDESIDCQELEQSIENANTYLSLGGYEFINVIEVNETNITLRFNYSPNSCIFKGTR